MFKSLAFYIGSRYTRAKTRNGFISFISLASMLGIALGVTVLITALSVMNGFNDEIKTRFFALMPQMSVLTNQSLHSDWRQLAKQVEQVPGVTGVAPFVAGKGIIMSHGDAFGVEAQGILPSTEAKVSDLQGKMVTGTLRSLQPGKFNIIIGQTLADDLGVDVGDKITVFTPQTSVTLAGVFPRYRRFTITGIFHASNAFGFDLAYAYMNMSDAARVFPASHGTRGVHIRVSNIYDVGRMSAQLASQLPPGYLVTNWTQSNGAFFQAIWMEKTILFVILMLIIAVAAFNLVSTLVMVVNDKRADIAILRTLGASPGTILRTFLVQGLIIGVIGTLLGVVGGVILATYATNIVNWYQSTFHVQLLQSSVFFVNYLPSKIEWSDVVIVTVLAVVLSLLAALYPAWMAFKTQPAEALRYDL